MECAVEPCSEIIKISDFFSYAIRSPTGGVQHSINETKPHTAQSFLSYWVDIRKPLMRFLPSATPE